MSTLGIVILIWGLAAAGMSLAFFYARKKKNMGYVDVFWALGMAVAAVMAGLLGEGSLASRVLVALFGGFWGVRLFRFLWHRVRGEAEDGRYQAMRAAIGDGVPRWFAFFQLQALVIALFSLPFVAAAAGAGASTAPGSGRRPRCGRLPSLAKRWPIVSWRRIVATPRRRAARVAAACGVGPGTPTTSSSGSTGSPTSRWRRRGPWPGWR